MRTPSVLLAALSFVASSVAQGPPEGIGPDAPAPEGCVDTYDGNFTINIAVFPNQASIGKRETAAEAAGSATVCNLKDGILHDTYGRTGSIVANYQFQFDGPPQAGAIYTGGWSICKNESLALGSSTVFYRCMSGAFGNLYDRHVGEQCEEINIVGVDLNKPSSSSSSSVASSTPSPTSASSTGSASASASSSSHSSAVLTPITNGQNGTLSTGTPSSSGASSARITSSPSPTQTGASAASSSGSTGAAVPTRVPRRETFGAVIGILGAALIL